MLDSLPAAFPRMSREEASDRVKLLSGLSASALAATVTTNTDSATFYQTATSRIQPRELDEIRARVLDLAKQHGFPNAQARGRSIAFDRALTIVLGELMNILPADAADEGVWSFFTLNVCPDVALWRFPNEAVGADNFRESYERLVGRPRNIFRRAWWRWYILGGDLSSKLIEDESVGIMERPSIGGNQRLARAFAQAHLGQIARGRVGSRQDLLREAIKHLRRTMGRISIHALDDAQLTQVIDRAFEQAAPEVVVESNRVAGGAVGSAIDRFRFGAAGYWHLLEPHAVEVPWSRMSELRMQLDGYRSGNSENEQTAARIASDLLLLSGRWDGFSSDERAVVNAAVSYFLELEDVIPDHQVGGLDDDNRVTNAAFNALRQLRD